jgi:hypothetical protein
VRWREGLESYKGHVGERDEANAETGALGLGFWFHENMAAGKTALRAFSIEVGWLGEDVC